jgi:hypothetical protein
VSTVAAMANTAPGGDPGELRARRPTPILDLLRDYRPAAMSFREALDAAERRPPRRSHPQRRRRGVSD